MKNINKGFTLVEVFVTVIIIGILSVIGGGVYKRRVDNAKYHEGMRLIQSIKEQEDIALSFAEDAANPFFYTDGAVISSTFTINRDAQRLGKFYIYPHLNKYFREFEIRRPSIAEESRYDIKGVGYIAEAYYPNKNNPKLLLRLVGSSEGSYTIIRE